MIARAMITRMRVNTMQARLLSTQGESALRKFQEVMREYRIAKYVLLHPRPWNCDSDLHES